MEKFYTYILYSQTVDRFYVGSTVDLVRRVSEHNSGNSKYTSRGKPWTLIWFEEQENRAVAVNTEYKIKKRGIRRFLIDINFDFSGCSAAR